MDHTIVKQRIEQFDLKHGESVYDGSWIYYADGAKREGNPLGALMEPSKDVRERHRCIEYYHQTRLDQAAAEFDEAKKRMLANPGHDEAKRKANLKRLRELKAKVVRLGEAYSAAAEARQRVEPGYRTPEEEAEDEKYAASQAAELAEHEAAIKAINI